MDNSVKKLIVNMSLQTGEYVFDDGNQIKRVSIVDCEDLEDLIYNTENEIMEVYGFSEDLVDQVDCFLYNGLKDIDEQYGSNYTVKYLNMIAKDIQRKPGEFKNRIIQIRKEILEYIGLELNYDVAIKGASENLSLSDRLLMKKVAKKQKENGANVNIHFSYKNTEKTLGQDEKISSDEVVEDNFEYSNYADSFNVTKPQQEEKYERTVVSSGEQQFTIRVDTSYETSSSETDRIEGTKRKIEQYNIKTREKRDRSMFKKPDTETSSEEKKEEISQNTDIPVSGEKEETVKTEEQVLEEKVVDKILITEEEQQEQSVKNEISEDKEELDTDKDFEESEEPEILKTKIKEYKFDETPIDEPKREARAQRFIRKFKDVKDRIQNKVFVSKPRFVNKKFFITGVIGIVATISAIGISAKAIISNMKANTQYETEYDEESLEKKEQEAQVNKEEYKKPAQESKNGMNAQQNDKINAQQTNQDSKQQKVKQDKKLQTVNTQKSKETEQANGTYKKAEKTNPSTEYLKSVRVGTRMKINKGSYFETPEGTGKVGYFRKHKGKVKIISKIGIATKEGYKSISTSDVSLLELKEKYPDAEFSYHIIDEKGNIFGWMTSKSFEQHISKDQSQMDNER